MNIKIFNAGRVWLLFIVLMLSSQQALANISGTFKIRGDNGKVDSHCITNGGSVKVYGGKGYVYLEGNSSCSLSSNKYVPADGYYSLYASADNGNGIVMDAKTSTFFVSASKTISQQTITAYGGSDNYSYSSSSTGSALIVCEYLVNESGKRYSILPANSWCSDGKPLPPTPVVPDTACTINSGNDLNVNLNTVDRAQLPTVPGSGSMRHLQIPVDCTGGSVTVNMKINYTPITFSAGQVVKSSSNGLGVSIVYNSKVISTTDTTPVTFIVGSNSVDLAFQAVRDPNVEIKDVPTGAFTASAVLVMTQQ